MALERGRPPLSYADVLELPPETPGEVIDGELIATPAPSPYHQHITDRIMFALIGHLDEHPGTGVAFSAPIDVVLRAERPAIVVQPDVIFIEAARTGIIGAAVMGPPALVVEVVSPSSSRLDAVRKRELYTQCGVTEYWLVWPEEQRIDVIALATAGPAREFGPADKLTSGVLPGFQLDVARVFARPW